jgi:4-hydroxybenzoate polyprenyltransferase
MSAAIVVALMPQASLAALVVALAGAWGFGWHMWAQLARLDIDDPDICLALFRSNRNAGLIPALFLAVAIFV